MLSPLLFSSTLYQMDPRPVYRFRADSNLLAQIYKIMQETGITVSSLYFAGTGHLLSHFLEWIDRISTVSLPAGSPDILKAINQEVIFNWRSISTANKSLKIVPSSTRFIYIICFLVSIYIHMHPSHPEYFVPRRFCVQSLLQRFPPLNKLSIPMSE